MEKERKQINIKLEVNRTEPEQGRVWFYATCTGTVDAYNNRVDLKTLFEIRDDFMTRYKNGEAVIDLDHDYNDHATVIESEMETFSADDIRWRLGVQATSPEAKQAIKEGITGGSIAGWFYEDKNEDGTQFITGPEMLAVSLVSQKYLPANPGAKTIMHKARSKKMETIDLKSKIALWVLKALMTDGAVQTEESVKQMIADAVKELSTPTQAQTINPEEIKGMIAEAVKTALAKGKPEEKPEEKPTETEEAKKIENLTTKMVEMEKKMAQMSAGSTGRLNVITDELEKKTSFPELSQILHEKVGGKRLLQKADFTSGNLLSGGTGLSVKEVRKFYDFVVDQTSILKMARRVNSTEAKIPFPYIYLLGPVWRKHIEKTDIGETVTAALLQRELTFKRIKAVWFMSDDLISDNIEGPALIDHVLSLVAKTGANEIERAWLIGDDSAGDDANHPIDNHFDGIYTILKNSLVTAPWPALGLSAAITDAMTLATRYWPGTKGEYIRSLLKKIPSKFKTPNDKWFTSDGVSLDYDGEIDANDYPLNILKSNMPVAVPNLPEDMAFTYDGNPYTDGTFTLRANPDNLVFGTRDVMSVETERSARLSGTYWVTRAELIADVENPGACGLQDHVAVKP